MVDIEGGVPSFNQVSFDSFGAGCVHKHDGYDAPTERCVACHGVIAARNVLQQVFVHAPMLVCQYVMSTPEESEVLACASCETP